MNLWSRRVLESKRCFANRRATGVNCFWLWQEKMETPILIIHVIKDLTTLHYFPSDDHPGFYSEGAMPGLDPDGDTVFFMNNLTEEEEFPNYKVVPFAAA